MLPSPAMTRTYSLLDSGGGLRLEQFGVKTVIRPSSLAIWKPRNPELWRTAAATYDHDAGWTFAHQQFKEWEVAIGAVKLTLRLQRNGQVGFFPDHTLYLDELVTAVKKIAKKNSRPPNMLNLFAYTGMASIVAMHAGAQVTHLDILKPALDWARVNAERNNLPSNALRLIPDDALTFMEREIKRGKH